MRVWPRKWKGLFFKHNNQSVRPCANEMLTEIIGRATQLLTGSTTLTIDEYVIETHDSKILSPISITN